MKQGEEEKRARGETRGMTVKRTKSTRERTRRRRTKRKGGRDMGSACLCESSSEAREKEKERECARVYAHLVSCVRLVTVGVGVHHRRPEHRVALDGGHRHAEVVEARATAGLDDAKQHHRGELAARRVCPRKRGG
eukprot:5425759-Pleurochrysis_carterae.AAC.1